MINKTVVALLFLLVTSVLTGCCCSDPNYQQNNTPIATNSRAVELAADQFGQDLAKHIINHPNIDDDIHCETIPFAVEEDNVINDKRQLCTLEILEYEPELITRMSFFIKSENRDITVIDSFHAEGESTLGQIGFSENGKYFYLVKTDEGHPWFIFYDTQKFLNDYMHAQVGDVFEEYFLSHIAGFYDNGDFIFALREDIVIGCDDNLDSRNEMKKETTSESTKVEIFCLIRHNIFEKYFSLSISVD
ncbi:hypothetical protein NBRC116592_03690 [Colwellia sp. KU-HH00111]|uniref:hypothetical protein n=1 Tax=Colwellia sp. KU-HH00111 TaxID=3127652 RepID=UPI0031092CFD